jgi:ubiquinone/menaquinone biosynthesis C-methylase UbiE
MNISIIKNKNEYINYIEKNFLITQCEKKEIINIFNNKFKFYVDQDSNKQIITFFKESINNHNIEEITRLQLLLQHFVNFNISEKTIEYLKTKKIKLNDTDIINFIIKQINDNNTKDTKDTKDNIKENIKDTSCDKWFSSIQSLSLIYNLYFKPKEIENKKIKFIDICCGSGKKTTFFSKSLYLSKENTYCTDIQTWGPYKNKNKIKIPYQFKYINDGKLDYEDNYFDLTTCILSLHHIKNLNEFIKEIYRITKPGGYFLLIEHSVENDYDRLFINIQHMFYSVFYDKKENYLENVEYTYCYNMYEWNYIMYKNKFYLKKEDPLSFGNKFNYKYDNIFYAFYQKKN